MSSRRLIFHCLPICIGILFLLFVSGCGGPSEKPDRIWGRKGVIDGAFERPRAIAIDPQDRIFVVDFTPRIQVFDLCGNYIGPTWTTPDARKGRPSGLGIDRDGNLMVCDSHYHCLRIYTADGREIKRLGGEAGSAPGQFGYISDALQDESGNYFLAEFGENDRITKLDMQGKFLHTWGKKGTAPGEFDRIRAMTFGPDRYLYVADACNDRIQVFDLDGTLIRVWGTSGSGPGELSYPYDLAFGSNGSLYVVEYGNCRVQKFTPDGKLLGSWGKPGGRQPGHLGSPWAIAVDRHGSIHIVDTLNHRVQVISF